MGVVLGAAVEIWKVTINSSKAKPKLIIPSTLSAHTHYLPSYLTALIDIEDKTRAENRKYHSPHPPPLPEASSPSSFSSLHEIWPRAESHNAVQMSTWVSIKKTQEICMHHLARRTSLVGRQPEALRRRRRQEEEKSAEERIKGHSEGRGCWTTVGNWEESNIREAKKDEMIFSMAQTGK